ncbi:hypothetical protein DMC30DRAFT_369979 [Rhodotorula diobovata]|uniref:NAD(P)-binding domain-containing protein n=1 Tax=Rhodotorula diobovata TaxID=5288 RepID=A0A5C5FLR2_9BASI|nr:hypothetical protein DMC30DRAFT_369979 [Rhodotorula diobovata]
MAKTLFLLGTGFIGGSVLNALLEDKKDQYTISALCRDPKKADKLKELGVRPVQGELASDELIAKEAAEADIIMHIATADDLPSVQSILKGLAKRSSSKAPAVYIHTSGTGVLTVPTRPTDVVFTDKDPKTLDEQIPDDAPHREVDLAIKKAVESKELNAKVSIILPPCIYGIGTGPFNKISIQCPLWIREAIREGKLISHGPDRTWNNIHIHNLVTGYLTLLSHLEQTSSPPPLYVFAETGVHRWGDIADVLDKELKQRKLISGDRVVDPEGSTDTETGTQSRATAEWLREWGWKVKDLPSLAESLPHEIDFMRETGAI